MGDTERSTRRIARPLVRAKAYTEGVEAPDAKPRSRRRTADSAERAYRTIRQLLVEFRIAPKERINEVRLSQSLGLSRTPVREALNRLAIEGFLTFSPNRGYASRGYDIDDLIELFEMRSIIETGTFAFACERADQGEIERLRDFWRHARPQYDYIGRDEIVEIDEAFHLRIAELAKNAEVVRQLRTVNARVRFIRRLLFESIPRDEELIRDHDRILDALSARDPAAGMDILRNHISLTFAQAREVLVTAVQAAENGSEAIPHCAP